MASIRDLVKKETGDGQKNIEATRALKKEYPLVAELLGGTPEKGDEKAVSAGSITFWVREGKIRATANCKDLKASFVMDILDILSPWKCIEYAMKSGECSQKEYTERGSKMTAEQEKLLL